MGRWFCLTRSRIADCEPLIRAFAKALTKKAYGGSRRMPRSSADWLPFLGIPEDRTRGGGRTFIHYHILVCFPAGRDAELRAFAKQFWEEKGETHFGSPITVDFKSIYDAGGVAGYSLKHLEDGWTLENTVIRGPITVSQS